MRHYKSVHNSIKTFLKLKTAHVLFNISKIVLEMNKQFGINNDIRIILCYYRAILIWKKIQP